jgi:hypothetical protein
MQIRVCAVLLLVALCWSTAAAVVTDEHLAAAQAIVDAEHNKLLQSVGAALPSEKEDAPEKSHPQRLDELDADVHAKIKGVNDQLLGMTNELGNMLAGVFNHIGGKKPAAEDEL